MKGAGANPPKINARPGTIKKYMTQEENPDSSTTEKIIRSSGKTTGWAK